MNDVSVEISIKRLSVFPIRIISKTITLAQYPLNEKQGTSRRNKLSNVYQGPTSDRVDFSAMENIKQARKGTNRTIHELNFDVEEQHVREI